MDNQLYFAIKKIIDISVAITLLIVFFPICIITAILIKMESPGPVFADTPPRVGKNGHLFNIYKFRSMIPNAHQLIRTDPKFKKLYEEYKKNSYKLLEDPRVTGVGKFIRKYSIDEIPQIINIFKGEMSLIGPRAYYADELEEQQKKHPGTKKHVAEVLKIKPGITGLWQTSGRSQINFDKRIEMDAFYAKKRSLGLDIKILAKTPWAMISGRGAV